MSVLEEQKSHLWRLSDFLCTYRFWVIANFFISIYGLKFIFFTQIPVLRQSHDLSSQLIGAMMTITTIGGMLGIIIALIISRSKSVYWLCFLSVMSIACLYFTQINQDVLVWGCCFTLISMLSIAALILAAGYIAQAAKKTITFIIIFGLIYACMNATPYSLDLFSRNVPYNTLTLNIIISLAIATLLLLFSHKRIFYTLPKRAIQLYDDQETTSMWTWGDLIGNYRFWILILFFMSASLGLNYMDTFVALYYSNAIGFDLFMIFSVKSNIDVLAGIVAIPVACVAYLCHRYWSLFILGLLLIIALFLSALMDMYILLFAIFLYKCVYFALLLVILAFIAKAINRVFDFVTTYSILFVCTQVTIFLSSILIGFIFNFFSSSLEHFLYRLPRFYHMIKNIGEMNLICGVLIFFIVIALIPLLLVNKRLFDMPTQKQYAIPKN